MITTNFTQKLVDLAADWLGCEEDAKTPNRSACLTDLWKLYGTEPTNEPWCAAFVWTMVNETCKVFGVENKLPHTKSTYEMKSRATNAGLKVDKTPAVGSIFYFTRDGGGHVGIVTNLGENTMTTIEGNVSDQVRLGRRALNSKNFLYIHVEKMTSKTLVFGKEPYYALLGVTGLATIYLTWKNVLRKK